MQKTKELTVRFLLPAELRRSEVFFLDFAAALKKLAEEKTDRKYFIHNTLGALFILPEEYIRLQRKKDEELRRRGYRI